jgi:hypothetical protein
MRVPEKVARAEGTPTTATASAITIAIEKWRHFTALARCGTSVTAEEPTPRESVRER